MQCAENGLGRKRDRNAYENDMLHVVFIFFFCNIEEL